MSQLEVAVELICPCRGRIDDARPNELIGRLYRCCFCGRLFVWEDALCTASGADGVVSRAREPRC